MPAELQRNADPAQGGGILFDLGSHLVDQALTLFGPATLEVAELRAVREGLGSEDDAFLSLRHESASADGDTSSASSTRACASAPPSAMRGWRTRAACSGVRSHLTMSRVAAQSGPRFRVLGDESGYSVYGLDGQEPALKVGRWPGSEGYGETPAAQWGLLGVDNGEQPLVPVPTEAGAYPRFYEQVAASILEGAPVPVDPRSALETVRIIEQSHAENRG